MQSLRVVFALAIGVILIAEPVFAQSVQDNARARAQKLEQQREADRKRALEKRFPVGVNWTLLDIGGKRPPAGVEATFRIDASFRAAGASGCNRYSAPMYPSRGQSLMAGPPALTRRTCPAPIMAFERTFLQGLYSRPQWDQVGDVLTLKTRVGVMRFQRTF